MRRHPILLRLALIGILLPLSLEPAFAQTGGMIIREAAYNLILRVSPVILIVSILTVVILGFTLVVSHEEAALGKAKSTLMAVAIGAIIVTVILMMSGGSFNGSTPLNGGFIGMFYSGINTLVPYSFSSVLNFGNADAIGWEAQGIADWITTMAAVFGILMIIIAALRAFSYVGADDSSYDKVRRAVLHTIIGLAIIGGAYLLRKAFYAPVLEIQGGAFGVTVPFPGGEANPNSIMLLIKEKIMIILGFLTIIAVAVLVYAGFRMVISFGKEDEFTAAKDLMFRVIVGLLIIGFSFTLVWIVAAIFK